MLRVVVVSGDEIEERLDPFQLEPHGRRLPAGLEAEDVRTGLGSDDEELGIDRRASRITPAAKGDAEGRVWKHPVHRSRRKRRSRGHAMRPHALRNAGQSGMGDVIAIVAEPATKQ